MSTTNRLIAAAAASALLAGPLASMADASTTSVAAPAAARGARIVVANATDEGRIDLFDGTGQTVPGSGFGSAFGVGDVVAAGNVVGDDALEVLLVNGTANDGPGLVTIFDLGTGQPIPGMSFDSAFDAGESVATGDVNDDGIDELLVANDEEGRVDVLDVRSGEVLPGFGIVDTTFDDHPDNGFAVGDADGDRRVEVFIANKSGGRIDVLDPDTGDVKPGFGIIDTTFNDDAESEFAVGDVDGDTRVEVLVANFSGGRIDVLDPDTGDVKPGFGIIDTTFNNSGENQFKVADVDGDGKAEALVANGGGNRNDIGRIDIFDTDQGETAPGLGVADSGFGADDIFAVSTFTGGDLDGDDIPDRVELFGIRNTDGNVVMDLTNIAGNDPASPCRKDILVEVDWMKGREPDTNVIPEIQDAFDNELVFPTPDCPYPGVSVAKGINLIVMLDEEIPAQPVLQLPQGFVDIKNEHFLKDESGNDRRALDSFVHYNVWADEAATNDPKDKFAGRVMPAEGHPEEDPQDFVLTLGALRNLMNQERTATVDEQRSTFMHELGHSIGLHHGGNANEAENEVNCKPNYLSEMNNFFSNGLRRQDANGITRTFHDFSPFGPEDLPDLNEGDLNEREGLGAAPSGIFTAWGENAVNFGQPFEKLAGGSINWDNDGDPAETPPDGQPPVQVDLNNNTEKMCESGGAAETHRAFDDWAFLNAGLGLWDDPAPPVEPTPATIESLATFWDQALFPDQKVALNAARPGFQAPALGVAVDAEHIYATHYYERIAPPHTSEQPGSLVILNRGTLAVEARVRVGANPRAVAINPVTNRIYVVNGGATGANPFSLSVVDGVSRMVVATIPLAQGPVDVAVNSHLNRVYVSNIFQRRIQVVDGATNALLDPIPIGPGPVGLAVDETTNMLYVALNHRSGPEPTVTALGAVVDDGVTRQILPPVDLSPELTQPIDVAVDPDHDRVYVAGLGGGGVAPSVIVLDQPTRTEITRVELDAPVRAIAVNGDAHQVFVAGEGGVFVIDDTTFKVVRTMPSGLSFAVATEPGSSRELFVGDLRSGELGRFSYSSGTPR